MLTSKFWRSLDVILRLPFCVFAGYSVQNYSNDSLMYWLTERITTIDWLCKAFSLLVMSSTIENAQKVH